MQRFIKDHLYFLCLLGFVIFTAVANGQTTWAIDETFAKNAVALTQQKIKDNIFVGLVAGVSCNGTIDWVTAKGYDNIKAQKAMTAEAVFRTASIAKPMTAVAIMQLVEKGLIDLDVPIQQYLPDFPVKKEGTITTRQLLNQTSGIPAYASTKETQTTEHYPTLADAVNVFKHRDLKHTPGTAFYYTTYGYVVLGLIIEKVSGLDYETYMTKNIWEKAGMNNTGVEKFGQPQPNKVSFYHKHKNGKMKAVKKVNNLSNRVPGGGFYSTLEDLLRFGDAILNNELIQPATLAMMLAKQPVEKVGNPYGFGWTMYGPQPNPEVVFGHNGAQTGTATQIMIIPDRKLVVAALSNTSGSGMNIVGLAVELIQELNSIARGTGE